jgi:type VI secretion system (T6SS) spike protein VgrG3/LysM domain-containing protein
MRYTVRSGDSLSTIAAAHGMTLSQLLAANPRFRASSDQLVVGDVLELPDTATPPPAPAPVTDDVTLGKLSEQFETGGRGPGTVSTGVGDAGGVSYGSYQMTSRNGGTVGQFVSIPDFPWHEKFLGLTPGTPAFTECWKSVAVAEPRAFYAAQHAYIKRTHFDVLAANVLNRDGLVVTTRSRAVQDAVWSTAVQHGPNTGVVHEALVSVRQQGFTPDAADFDRALIKAIYAERERRNTDGELVHFASDSAAVQDSVARRFVVEERDALQMLDGR